MSRRRAAVLATGIGLLVASALLGSAPAALADDSSTQGVGIQAQVTQAPPTDGGAGGTSTGGGRTGTSSGSGSGPAASQPPFDSEVLGAGGSAATPAPSSTSVATGVLAVSGLRVVSTPSMDPRAGDLHVEATVRNLSDQVMEVGTQFSATTVFGMVLDRAAPTTVSRLAPGELRVVEANLSGMGQWGVVVAHLTLRPPTQVDGADVGPITRDRWVVLPPWFALGAGVVLVAGGLVWWRAGRVAAPVRVGAVG